MVCIIFFTLIGCSDTQSEDSDILSEIADFNFLQSFNFEEEKSITMSVEIYENGHRKDAPLMYFGNHFKGNGKIQFSYFRPDLILDDSGGLKSFITGVIQDEQKTIPSKVIDAPLYTGYLFDAAKENTITKEGIYNIGVLGYLTDEDAASPFIKEIQILERADFIEEYKEFPVVYLVVIEVQ